MSSMLPILELMLSDAGASLMGRGGAGAAGGSKYGWLRR